MDDAVYEEAGSRALTLKWVQLKCLDTRRRQRRQQRRRFHPLPLLFPCLLEHWCHSWLWRIPVRKYGAIALSSLFPGTLRSFRCFRQINSIASRQTQLFSSTKNASTFRAIRKFLWTVRSKYSLDDISTNRLRIYLIYSRYGITSIIIWTIYYKDVKINF